MFLGYQALIGCSWWVLSWFLYVKTNTTDAVLNPDTPLGWFWSNLSSPTDGWMAASYMTTFVTYLLVSFIELIAWVLYTVDYPMFAAFYFSTVGYYGSIILYSLPWIFALLHMVLPTASGGLNSATTAAHYSNDLFLMITGIVMWVGISVAHILFVPKFIEHAKALRPECHCDSVEPLPETASNKELEAFALKNEAACLAKCPPMDMCTVSRQGLMNEEWLEQCRLQLRTQLEE